jgi:hypothetical protein
LTDSDTSSSERDAPVCPPNLSTTVTPLGNWVIKARTRYRAGKLAASRGQRLKALPGWISAAKLSVRRVTKYAWKCQAGLAPPRLSTLTRSGTRRTKTARSATTVSVLTLAITVGLVLLGIPEGSSRAALGQAVDGAVSMTWFGYARNPGSPTIRSLAYASIESSGVRLAAMCD